MSEVVQAFVSCLSAFIEQLSPRLKLALNDKLVKTLWLKSFQRLSAISLLHVKLYLTLCQQYCWLCKVRFNMQQ